MDSLNQRITMIDPLSDLGDDGLADLWVLRVKIFERTSTLYRSSLFVHYCIIIALD